MILHKEAPQQWSKCFHVSKLCSFILGIMMKNDLYQNLDMFTIWEAKDLPTAEHQNSSHSS